MTNDQRRIRTRGLIDTGLVNWVICRIAARAVGAKRMNLFFTLAPHKRLFWAWLPFSGVLLGVGRLSREDTELVILRVGHLCKCEYELQHHRKIARRYGLDQPTQEKIAAHPHSEGLSYQQTALLDAVDELVLARDISQRTWARLAHCFDEKQLIELCVLITQYEALAKTIEALKIPLDFPTE